MLKNYLFNFRFFKFIQNGMYIDFFIKKIIESYVKNSLIYSSQFFGEKYIIEYFTKKIIDSVIFNSNKIFSFIDLFYSFFFIQLISVFFYTIIFLNLLFIIL